MNDGPTPNPSPGVSPGASPVLNAALPLPPRRGGSVPRVQEVGLIVVILLIGGVLTALRGKEFLNAENLIDGIATQMSVYAIMAVGVSCTIIAGGIDISVGSIVMLSALGVTMALQQNPDAAPMPWFKSAPIALMAGGGIGLLCGLINGALVVGFRLHPFIVTLGTMSIFHGIGNRITGTEKTLPNVPKVLPESFLENLMQRYSFVGSKYLPPEGIRLMPSIVMLIVVAIGWIYLRLMVAGRETYAVGGNEEAARYSGLRVNLIKMRVYAISGLTAGIAGIVYVGRFATASTGTGAGDELMVIAAAVVGGASLSGGRGTAVGALLGALVLQMINNAIYVLKLNQENSTIISGSAIIVAAVIDRLSETLRQRRLVRSRELK